MVRKNIKPFVFRLLWVAFVFCLTGPTLASADAPPTGIIIAQKAFGRDRGQNSISSATMILEDKNGNTRSRGFTIKRMLADTLEKRLLRFTSPADINGTGFLTIEKPGHETDQFLYLPALRRSRRIVSSQKFHKFVNSDFTYEDMERHSMENFLYEIRGEKTIDNTECYLLDIRPRETDDSQYSLITAGISKESFIFLHADYYDRKGTHIKTYRVAQLEKKQDIWTETRVIMEDVITGHKTVIIIEDIEYNADITADQISKAALEHF